MALILAGELKEESMGGVPKLKMREMLLRKEGAE